MRTQASSTISMLMYPTTLRSESCASAPPEGAAGPETLIQAIGLR